MIKPMIKTGMLLLALCAAPVFAQYNGGGDPRAYRQQERAVNNEAQRQERQGDARINQNPYVDQSGNSQRNGRMSAEDRRALRRQINEASQDIYSNRGR